MTTAKDKTKLWPPIHRLTYNSGNTRWQVACMIQGERIREVYDTKEQAEARAAQIRLKVANEGATAFNLPPDIRTEAARAVETLAPYSATITEAVAYYVEHILTYHNAPPIAAIVERMSGRARPPGAPLFSDQVVGELRDP